MELPEIIVKSLYGDTHGYYYWILVQPVKVTLSNGGDIVIPVNFTTDFASVPWLLWGVIPTTGNHNLAALVHDYLYYSRYQNRLFCDRELFYWLRKTGSNKLKAYLMYWTVRVWGAKWWRQEFTK